MRPSFVAVPTDPLPLSLSRGDFNVDGRPDLVVVRSAGARIFLNGPGGALAADIGLRTGPAPRQAGGGGVNGRRHVGGGPRPCPHLPAPPADTAMTWGVVVKNGLAYVNDMYNGLWIVRIEPKPQVIP